MGLESLNDHLVNPHYFAVNFIPIINYIKYNASVSIQKTDKVKLG